MADHRILIVILFCGVIACSLAGCAAPASTDTWAVIPEGRAEEMGIGTWLLNGAEIEGYWTPTAGDIRLLEENLASFLQANATSFRREPPVWERLENYKRQYAGLVMNGKRVIYGNFFCSEPEPGWKEEWLFVMDGGDCFFQLQFDVANSTFSGLTVNGDA
jgi:hypothetical protein